MQEVDDGREELALAAIKRRKRAELAPSEGGAMDWPPRKPRPTGPASIKHLLPPDLGWANIQDVESAVLARVSVRACMSARCTLAKHLFMFLTPLRGILVTGTTILGPVNGAPLGFIIHWLPGLTGRVHCRTVQEAAGKGGSCCQPSGLLSDAATARAV